jgi:hypothetical protein
MLPMARRHLPEEAASNAEFIAGNLKQTNRLSGVGFSPHGGD